MFYKYIYYLIKYVFVNIYVSVELVFQFLLLLCIRIVQRSSIRNPAGESLFTKDLFATLLGDNIS